LAAGGEPRKRARTTRAASQSLAAAQARSATPKVTGDCHPRGAVCEEECEAGDEAGASDGGEDGGDEEDEAAAALRARALPRSRTACQRSRRAGTGLAVLATAQAAKHAAKLRSFGTTTCVVEERAVFRA
jgi:hypothetical protein